VTNKKAKEDKTMDEIENYRPEIIDESGNVTYVKVLIQVQRCPLCNKYMVETSRYGPFPDWFPMSLKEQMKRAGFVERSDIRVDASRICVPCAEAGKADFLCALCKQRKPSSKKKDSFGDPPEYLCTDCYETIPAAKWEQEVERLQDEHEYDFE
jgi:hypothetical protein